MAIVKTILTGLDLFVMIAFIFFVMIQAGRSEGLFTGGGASSTYMKSKPGFEDSLSRYTLYLAIAFFVLTAVITYFP